MMHDTLWYMIMINFLPCALLWSVSSNYLPERHALSNFFSFCGLYHQCMLFIPLRNTSSFEILSVVSTLAVSSITTFRRLLVALFHFSLESTFHIHTVRWHSLWHNLYNLFFRLMLIAQLSLILLVNAALAIAILISILDTQRPSSVVMLPYVHEAYNLLKTDSIYCNI